MLTNLMFLVLENFTNSDRTRILIHTSNYFQTLESMEKTLFDKNDPNEPKIKITNHAFLAWPKITIHGISGLTRKNEKVTNRDILGFLGKM